MTEHISFGKIGQFRDVVSQIRKNCQHSNIVVPILKFNGTAKIHGTNASIVYDSVTHALVAQSRNNIVTVGKFFGVDGIGEGIVWTCNVPDFKEFTFKTKGEKHSDSHVKTIVEVDVEKADSIRAFVDIVATPHRLDKAIAFLKETKEELSNADIGAYIKWVCQDVLAEETDRLVASGLDWKSVAKQLTMSAKNYWNSGAAYQ